MQITLGQAFKNVFSEKYNKVNCGLWIPIIIIMGSVNLIKNSNEVLPESLSMILLLLIPICFILNIGIQYLGTHNAIFHYKNGVIPNLLNDFIKILLTGIKHSFGLIFSSLCFYVVPLAICFIITVKLFNAPIIALILVPFLILVITFFYICIVLNVFLTLKFGAWFNVAKAYKLWKKVSVENRFAVFLLKASGLFVLFIITSLIIAIPFLVLSVIGGVSLNITNKIHMTGSMLIYISIATGILSLIYNLLYIDITAQLLNMSYPNINIRKKSKKPISKSSNKLENNIKQDLPEEE